MTADAAGGGRVRTGSNPFNVDPDLDLLHVVPEGIPGWSETMFFHVWSPADQVGIFIHLGRWPGDLDLWWAQVIALLPDGGLLVDRSWGRALDERGPATGNLRVACVEPLHRWRLTFDGAGEATTLESMAAAPAGAGPARAFGFEVELEAAAPVWDLHAALGIDGLNWASAHHTQGFRAAGWLKSGECQWSLDGVALRDHSSGPRDIGGLGGLHFFLVVFPGSGRVVNGLVNWRRDGRVDHRTYAIQEAGLCETGAEVCVTGLESYASHEPRDLSITLGRADGSRYAMHAEWLHGYTLTLLEPNENINGVDLSSQDDPLIITQGTVRVVAPDGEVGYGVVERDYRPSILPSPEAR